MRERLKEFTLLYAEDESEVQSKMTEYFKTYFKTVQSASNGQEALELHKQHLPDVVILDINMPKVDGLEVAKRIRKQDTRTRIIMLTAHSEKELLLQATEIDMSKYLIKPVSPYDLKQALNKVASELILATEKAIKDSFDYTITEGGFIHKNKVLLHLSKSERLVLGLLIKSIGYTVEYKTFFYSEDDTNDTGNEASLRNTVAKLRKKCSDIEIKNIKDVGYIATHKAPSLT